MTDESAEPQTDEQLVSLEDVERLFASKGLERLQLQKELGVINPIMLAKALDVRPQMIYNYIRNGRIKTVDTNTTQKIVISADEAAKFAQEYLERKARKKAQIDRELEGG